VRAPRSGSYGPLCSGGASITLAGTPAGGTWSGTGVTGNQFNPSAGTQTVSYSVTQNGCTGSASTTITVNAAPTVSTGSYGPLCSSDAVDHARRHTRWRNLERHGCYWQPVQPFCWHADGELLGDTERLHRQCEHHDHSERSTNSEHRQLRSALQRRCFDHPHWYTCWRYLERYGCNWQSVQPFCWHADGELLGDAEWLHGQCKHHDHSERRANSEHRQLRSTV
jgi:hypothetical protein